MAERDYLHFVGIAIGSASEVRYTTCGAADRDDVVVIDHVGGRECGVRAERGKHARRALRTDRGTGSCVVEQGREHRVLVVDDNPDVANAIARGLEHFGYTVRTANDGLSGLEIAVEFRPHAAVIDLSLPMLDGWELAERFSTLPLFRKPRLIALTGLCSQEHRSRSTASGFHHHLVKPTSLMTLDKLLSI